MSAGAAEPDGVTAVEHRHGILHLKQVVTVRAKALRRSACERAVDDDRRARRWATASIETAIEHETQFAQQARKRALQRRLHLVRVTGGLNALLRQSQPAHADAGARLAVEVIAEREELDLVRVPVDAAKHTLPIPLNRRVLDDRSIQRARVDNGGMPVALQFGIEKEGQAVVRNRTREA